MAMFLRYIGDGKIKSFEEAASGVGDVTQTTFLGNNNQSPASMITGLLFDPALVSASRIFMTSDVSATTSFHTFYLIDIKENNGSWLIETSFMGDNPGIVFTVTDAGQVEYTSPSFPGFTELLFSFRAFSVKK